MAVSLSSKVYHTVICQNQHISGVNLASRVSKLMDSFPSLQNPATLRCSGWSLQRVQRSQGASRRAHSQVWRRGGLCGWCSIGKETRTASSWTTTPGVTTGRSCRHRGRRSTCWKEEQSRSSKNPETFRLTALTSRHSIVICLFRKLLLSSNNEESVRGSSCNVHITDIWRPVTAQQAASCVRDYKFNTLKVTLMFKDKYKKIKLS